MSVSWLVEKQVILVTLKEHVNLEDIKVINETIIDHLNEGEADVHIIVDLKKLLTFPNTLQALHKVLTFLQHPNLGYNITIVDNRLMQFVSMVINRILGRYPVQFVKTYEEAIELLHNLDPSINILSHHVDKSTF